MLGNEGLLHLSDCGLDQNGNAFSEDGAEAGEQHKIIYSQDVKEKEINIHVN